MQSSSTFDLQVPCLCNLVELDHDFIRNRPSTVIPPIRRNLFDRVDILLHTISHEQWKEHCNLHEQSSNNLILDGIKQSSKIHPEMLLPYFFALRLRQGVDQIQKQKTTDNEVAITYIYNHGFVLESSDAVIGIDLAGPGVIEFKEILDAIVVSHWHEDHFNRSLITYMLRAGKPVFARGTPPWLSTHDMNRCIDPADSDTFGFGSLTLRFHRGHHYPAEYTRYNPNVPISLNNVIDTIITFNTSATHSSLTMFHDGDDFSLANKRSAIDTVKPDIFMGHGVPAPTRWNTGNCDCDAWRNLNDSIGAPLETARAADAKLFIPGHMAERGHPDCVGGCIPFADALTIADLLPNHRAAVLMWGERIRICATPGFAGRLSVT